MVGKQVDIGEATCQTQATLAQHSNHLLPPVASRSTNFSAKKQAAAVIWRLHKCPRAACRETGNLSQTAIRPFCLMKKQYVNKAQLEFAWSLVSSSFQSLKAFVTPSLAKNLSSAQNFKGKIQVNRTKPGSMGGGVPYIYISYDILYVLSSSARNRLTPRHMRFENERLWGHLSFSVLVSELQMAVGQKKGNPKMACPGKWKQGLIPVVPWWFNFDPYPNLSGGDPSSSRDNMDGN